MKKLADLSLLEKSQISAYLRNFDADEPISVFPICTWDKISDVGLTVASFKKCLNKFAELGFGKFAAGTGRVSFRLTPKGKKWLAGEVSP